MLAGNSDTMSANSAIFPCKTARSTSLVAREAWSWSKKCLASFSCPENHQGLKGTMMGCSSTGASLK